MSDPFQYGSVNQRLKSPLVMQSPPTRTNTREDSSLTEPYCDPFAFSRAVNINLPKWSALIFKKQ
ncbi:hypothetical protein [Chamaesiphon sp.]|uniref:hypothetical protein n=1 Tax=Chamaesiphon sp. TaxID=2814140 RepID=UPI003593EE5F